MPSLLGSRTASLFDYTSLNGDRCVRTLLLNKNSNLTCLEGKGQRVITSEYESVTTLTCVLNSMCKDARKIFHAVQVFIPINNSGIFENNIFF